MKAEQIAKQHGFNLELLESEPHKPLLNWNSVKAMIEAVWIEFTPVTDEEIERERIKAYPKVIGERVKPLL